ncbi:acyltransferase family protein [Subtercola sp. YIM 133946]|uniref:acyltransferase family protein n=1 Tax=Subtercola sp. YIM 133946 TaxID=3118909 RepID=UPI002F93C048
MPQKHLSSAKPSPSGTRGIRLDIEGLRAVAVLSVLIYHLNGKWLPGGFAGVDMFFVISGFLITSHLLGESRRKGRPSLRAFYARRIMRLIPASTLVLIATSIGVMVVVPRILWSQIGTDIMAAGVYSLNWLLASQSIDYLAEDTIASPVQHFWSLGVEEQFYLIWPLLIILAIVWARKSRLAPRATANVGALVVFIASFAYAQHQVAIGDVSAYFTTTTRLWELAAGALVAINIGWFRGAISHRWFGALTMVGLVMLIWTIFFIDSSAWPGFPALVPVVAVALIILAGDTLPPSVAQRILSIRPMVWIGSISYAIYLWHWPLIVLASYKWPNRSTAINVGLIVLSVALAWASSRFIETPLRFAKWFKVKTWRSFVFGAVAIAVSVSLGAVLLLAGPTNALKPPAGAAPAGAAALPETIDLSSTTAAEWVSNVAWVLPAPLDAVQDVPPIYADGCQQSDTSSDPVSCTYGDKSSLKTMVLVGDSKAAQWMPALDIIAKKHGMKLVTFLKSSCSFADANVTIDGRSYPSCTEWNAKVTSELDSLRPSLVVTSQVRAAAETPGSGGQDTDTGRSLMTQGLEQTWQHLLSNGSKVLVIGDTPQVGSNVYECVGENPDNLAVCAYPRQKAVDASAQPTQRLAVAALHGEVIDAAEDPDSQSTPSQLALIDMDAAICPSETSCPPVIGNVLIYRSGSHITATYVGTLAQRLEANMLKASLVD